MIPLVTHHYNSDQMQYSVMEKPKEEARDRPSMWFSMFPLSLSLELYALLDESVRNGNNWFPLQLLPVLFSHLTELIIFMETFIKNSFKTDLLA